jgi:hypothetical protein
MSGKKALFLSLALILPVAIFIFLKIFGRNEFEVPVLYENEKIEVPANCDFEYRFPYRVADSVFSSLTGNQRDSLYVFYFDHSLNSAIRRVSVEFKGASVKPVAASDLPENTDLRVLRECVLLMGRDTSVALVDHRNRIRGYYNGSDRDEVDRLIVEIKIILKEY